MNWLSYIFDVTDKIIVVVEVTYLIRHETKVLNEKLLVSLFVHGVCIPVGDTMKDRIQ